MANELKHIAISFCEPNGDVILNYDIYNSLSGLIPNVGDKVNLDGTYRKVIEKAFSYSPLTIIVMIYLEEVEESKERFSFE